MFSKYLGNGQAFRSSDKVFGNPLFYPSGSRTEKAQILFSFYLIHF